jgi:hypothetical protein
MSDTLGGLLPVGIPGIVHISDTETVYIGCGCINDLQFEMSSEFLYPV